MSPCGFRDIVRKAQAGDVDCREELFRFTRPLIERLVPMHKLAPGESVNDRAQNVCLRIQIKLDQFDGAQHAPDDEQTWALFISWVRQIVFTMGVNANREREPFTKVPIAPPADSTTPGTDPPGSEATPSTCVRADEEAQRVRAAIESLPDPINRDIIRMRFFEGLSLHEIKERLSLTYDVVRERYRTTKLRLRRELRELE